MEKIAEVSIQIKSLRDFNEEFDADSSQRWIVVAGVESMLRGRGVPCERAGFVRPPLLDGG
jgi:hypothetical protein